jgi:hypothetical protein
MVMTYNSLVLQIQAETERTDSNSLGTGFLNQIPNFIMFAQQRMCRDSKSLLLEQYVVGTFIAGNPVIPKPGRWRRSITFNYGTGNGNTTVNIVQLRSYEFLRMYWPDPVVTGLPLFYSDYGFDHLLIAPTPSAAYPFEYGYLELPQPITIANQVNSLTNLAPDLLFAACMVEASQYLKNFGQSAYWEQKYQTVLAPFNNQDDLRIVDRTADRRAD